MKEKVLLGISLCCALAGVFILYLLVLFRGGTLLDYDGFGDVQDESVNFFEGVVVGVFVNNESTSIIIDTSERKKILVFDMLPEFGVGDYVQVRGELDKEDDKVILAEEVRVV